MPKIFVPESPNSQTGTLVEVQPQTTAPSPSSGSSVPPSSGSSVLIDGAAGSVILLSLVGMVKMGFSSWMKSSEMRRRADLQYQADNRKSELEIEQATANALRSGFESQQKALLESNAQLTSSLIGQVTEALKDIATSQSRLNSQAEATAGALEHISATQLEISQVLREIRHDLNQRAMRPLPPAPRSSKR